MEMFLGVKDIQHKHLSHFHLSTCKRKTFR